MFCKLNKVADQKRRLLVSYHNSAFFDVFQKLQSRILAERAYLLLEFLGLSFQTQGDCLELGIHKGRYFYLFDTFQGTPKVTSSLDNPRRARQYADTCIHAVSNRLKEFNLFTIFAPGFIPDTLMPYSKKTILFAHIHLNLYQSTLDALYAIFPQVYVGSVLLIKDYGLLSCAGVKQAADEFCDAAGVHLLHLPSGQGVIFKYA